MRIRSPARGRDRANYSITGKHNRRRPPHRIITGEPFLQADKVRALCLQLKRVPFSYYRRNQRHALYVEECRDDRLFSLSQIIRLCSPAPHMDHHNKTRINIGYTIIYHVCPVKTKRLSTKIRLLRENDVLEIQALFKTTGWMGKRRHLLMPMGTRRIKPLDSQNTGTFIRNGRRFCDRLHIFLATNKEYKYTSGILSFKHVNIRQKYT